MTELLVTASPAFPKALRVTRSLLRCSEVLLEQSLPMLLVRVLMKSATSGCLAQSAWLSQSLCTMAETPRRALVWTDSSDVNTVYYCNATPHVYIDDSLINLINGCMFFVVL